MIQICIDENIDPRVAAGLQQQSIPVLTAQEAGLLGADDEAQLNHATAHSCLLLTHDTDFLKIADTLRQKSVTHPGIIYVRLRKYGIGTIIKKVAAIARENTPETVTNRVIYL